MRQKTRTLFSVGVAMALVTTVLHPGGRPAVATPLGGPAVATPNESTSSSTASFARRDIQEFDIPTPDSGATDLAVGPDGNLWFTEHDANKIGRITPNGVITEFTLPVDEAEPFGIAAGPDGAVWFTTTDSDAKGIGRITPQGTINLYPLPTSQDSLREYAIMGDIVPGPGGGLWWAEGNRLRIGRATVDGTIDKSDWGRISSGNMFRWVGAITNGPDGNVWWTDPFEQRVGRITPAGAITHFPLPNEQRPYGIASGPDGNLWVTVRGTEGAVGRMTPAGQFVEFPLEDDFGSPSAIATGPDGNLWVTGRLHRERSHLLRVTPTGETTYFELPFGLGQQDLYFPDGMVTGPDGYLWLVDSRRNKILRIDVAGRSLNYVALGDSIASGEGGEDYDFTPGTDEFHFCHRSINAYPRVFGARTGVSTTLAACSGAKIRHIQGADQTKDGESVEPQILSIQPETDLVTVTVGANDLGWGNVIKACYVSANGHCQYEFRMLQERIGDLQPKLESLYEQVALVAGDDTDILVVGYPHFFPRPADLSNWEHIRRCKAFHSKELRWLRWRFVDATVVMTGAVEALREKGFTNIHFLNTLSAFENHERCTEGAWVHGFQATGEGTDFHPTKAGHRAIAERVEQWWHSQDWIARG